MERINPFLIESPSTSPAHHRVGTRFHSPHTQTPFIGDLFLRVYDQLHCKLLGDKASMTPSEPSRECSVCVQKDLLLFPPGT